MIKVIKKFESLLALALVQNEDTFAQASLTTVKSTCVAVLSVAFLDLFNVCPLMEQMTTCQEVAVFSECWFEKYKTCLKMGPNPHAASCKVCKNRFFF